MELASEIGVNKSEKRGNGKGEIPGLVEIFRWLLRNGMNKTNTNGVEAKV